MISVRKQNPQRERAEQASNVFYLNDEELGDSRSVQLFRF